MHVGHDLPPRVDYRRLFAGPIGEMAMLVKLTSSTSGEVILFAEHAHRLFEIIGKERTARGVFALEQLPDALARLRQAVADEKVARPRDPQAQPDRAEHDKAEDADAAQLEPAVGLAQRAYPLIRLMERTQKDGGFILWEAASDF